MERKINPDVHFLNFDEYQPKAGHAYNIVFHDPRMLEVLKANRFVLFEVESTVKGLDGLPMNVDPVTLEFYNQGETKFIVVVAKAVSEEVFAVLNERGNHMIVPQGSTPLSFSINPIDVVVESSLCIIDQEGTKFLTPMSMHEDYKYATKRTKLYSKN